MITTKQYNKLSKEDIPVLKKGEVAIYVNSKNTVVDNVPKFPRLYLPNKDTINNPSGDGVVDIAYIVADAPDGQEPRFGEIVFEPADKGIIICSGDNVLDQRKYAYLELSNHNGNNKNRDTTKEVYFFRRVPGQASEDALGKARKEALALNFADNTPIEQLRVLVSERRPVDGLNDSDLRLVAMDEYKKSPFTEGAATKNVPLPVSPPAQAEQPLVSLAQIAEMFESDVLKWSVSSKCIVNTETGTMYEVPGLTQTDKPEVKHKKLLDYLLSDNVALKQMADEIKSALG